jgi:hypothetical protein
MEEESWTWDVWFLSRHAGHMREVPFDYYLRISQGSRSDKHGLGYDYIL